MRPINNYSFILSEMKKDEVMLGLKLQFNFCIANKNKIGFSQGKKVYPDMLQKRKKHYVRVEHTFVYFGNRTV